MAKFNIVVEGKTAKKNLAGGKAYAQDAETELTSHVLTSFVTDQYYRSESEGIDRLVELLDQVDPEYSAKLAVYARNEFGMRSVSHVLASEVTRRVSGKTWTKEFVNSVIRRPDDITEILAYSISKYGKPLPKALQKGLANAFSKFDEYQLAKYRGEGKNVSLVDAVNIVHPKPVEKNREALEKLVNGELKSFDTWEKNISAAGSDSEAKEAAWKELVSTGKIGYFALLRNLRNIEDTGNKELINQAAELLIDENRIRKSLVLPFRYLVANREISNATLTRAIGKAIDISLDNIPELNGKTVVVIDHSASMGNRVAKSSISCKEAGDVFAAALFKKLESDVVVFGTDAGYVNGLNPDDSVLSIANQISRVNYGNGTSFPSIFSTLKEKYDRIIIFSDMQSWITDGENGYYNGYDSLVSYKNRSGANPFTYSFDLSGYGTSQFKNRNFELAGFSEKIFDTMSLLETDKNALVNTIKEVQF